MRIEDVENFTEQFREELRQVLSDQDMSLNYIVSEKHHSGAEDYYFRAGHIAYDSNNNILHIEESSKDEYFNRFISQDKDLIYALEGFLFIA